MVCLHRRMVRLHTHSLPSHVFARVVSHCPLCSFRLPECPDVVGPLLTLRQPLSLPLPVERATQHRGQV